MQFSSYSESSSENKWSSTEEDDPGCLSLELSTEDVSVTAGFKVVFDNIDMNVKPRYMRGDFQTRSLHYVNAYAVKDRINFSQFSDDVPSNLCILDVIPS